MLRGACFLGAVSLILAVLAMRAWWKGHDALAAEDTEGGEYYSELCAAFTEKACTTGVLGIVLGLIGSEP